MCDICTTLLNYSISRVLYKALFVSFYLLEKQCLLSRLLQYFFIALMVYCVDKSGKTTQVKNVPGFVNLTNRWRKNLPSTKEANILFALFLYFCPNFRTVRLICVQKSKCCSFDDNSWLPNLVQPEYLLRLQFKNWMSFSLIVFS